MEHFPKGFLSHPSNNGVSHCLRSCNSAYVRADGKWSHFEHHKNVGVWQRGKFFTQGIWRMLMMWLSYAWQETCDLAETPFPPTRWSYQCCLLYVFHTPDHIRPVLWLVTVEKGCVRREMIVHLWVHYYGEKKQIPWHEESKWCIERHVGHTVYRGRAKKIKKLLK